MNRIRPTYITIFIVAVSFIVTAVVLVNIFRKNDHSYYFKVRGLLYYQSDTVSLGDSDQVIYSSTAASSGMLKIWPVAEGFAWRSKPGLYLKLNDSTQNKLRLEEGDILQFGASSISLTEVKQIITPFKETQRYFLVYDLFAHLDRPVGNSENELPRSLLVITGECLDLIMLDPALSIRRGEQLIKPTFSGITSTAALKVEMINVVTSTFLRKKPLFNNRSVNVPTIRTEWQASHLLFSKVDTKSFKVLYSQPLIVAFNDEVIRSISETNASRSMSLSQVGRVGDQRCYYFESFSNLFPLPVLTVRTNDSSRIITFSSRQTAVRGQGPDIVPLSGNHHFGIVAPAAKHHHVEAICDFDKIGNVQLALPFIILLAIVVVMAFVLFFLVNPAKGWLERLIANKAPGLNTDAELIDVDARSKTFLIFRLPVLSVLYVLLIAKLIICTKLSLTHPYFPQLYFIGCLMAFTTPVLVCYFWARSSLVFRDASGRYSAGRILLMDLLLVILVWGLYWLSWQLFGGTFYAHYFESYNVDPYQFSPRGIARLISHEISKTRYFQINLLILALPVAILIGNLSVFVLKSLLQFFAKLLHVSNITMPTLDALKSFTNTFGIFLLACAALFFITRTLAIVHVLLIVAAYMIFRMAQMKRKKWIKIGITLVLLFVILGGIIKWRDDVGFIINYLLAAWFILFTILIVRFSPSLEIGGRQALITKIISIIVPLVFIPGFFILVNKATKPSLTDEQRFSRRVAAVIHEDAALATGGRQFIGDAQFLQYAKLSAVESFKKPSFVLADKTRPLHPLVSKGLYTVIINDLNPLVFLDYGGWFMLIAIALLWLLLYCNRIAIWNSDFHLYKQGISTEAFQFAQLVRYMPVLIIISNSVWMFLSLFGIVFFTGRLVNGFGVDAASEWIETILLFAFMGFVVNSSLTNKENKR